MELRVLKYFLTVAREENMTRAAEILHTSQSNLSRQLGELEDELGKTLMVRGSRRITLTEEGAYLRKRAAEILELAERTEEEIRGFDAEPSGTVYLGAAETRVMHRLSLVMAAVQREHPGITFDLFSGSTQEITERVDKGLLDFALMLAPIDLAKYDYLRLPVTERTGLLMRRDHPLTAKPSVRPSDVKGVPLLVSRQQLDANALGGWLGEDMTALNIVSTFNLITTPAMMVESGMGCAFTLENLVYTGEGSPLCFRPLEPAVEETFYLFRRKGAPLSPAANVFLRHVQADISETNPPFQAQKTENPS